MEEPIHLLWFVCKFCKRAFNHEEKLLSHKVQLHSQEIRLEKKRESRKKRREKKIKRELEQQSRSQSQEPLNNYNQVQAEIEIEIEIENQNQIENQNPNENQNQNELDLQESQEQQDVPLEVNDKDDDENEDENDLDNIGSPERNSEDEEEEAKEDEENVDTERIKKKALEEYGYDDSAVCVLLESLSEEKIQNLRTKCPLEEKKEEGELSEEESPVDPIEVLNWTSKIKNSALRRKTSVSFRGRRRKKLKRKPAAVTEEPVRKLPRRSSIQPVYKESYIQTVVKNEADSKTPLRAGLRTHRPSKFSNLNFDLLPDDPIGESNKDVLKPVVETELKHFLPKERLAAGRVSEQTEGEKEEEGCSAVPDSVETVPEERTEETAEENVPEERSEEAVLKESGQSEEPSASPVSSMEIHSCQKCFKEFSLLEGKESHEITCLQFKCKFCRVICMDRPNLVFHEVLKHSVELGRISNLKSKSLITKTTPTIQHPPAPASPPPPDVPREKDVDSEGEDASDNDASNYSNNLSNPNPEIEIEIDMSASVPQDESLDPQGSAVDPQDSSVDPQNESLDPQDDDLYPPTDLPVPEDLEYVSTDLDPIFPDIPSEVEDSEFPGETIQASLLLPDQIFPETENEEVVVMKEIHPNLHPRVPQEPETSDEVMILAEIPGNKTEAIPTQMDISKIEDNSEDGFPRIIKIVAYSSILEPELCEAEPNHANDPPRTDPPTEPALALHGTEPLELDSSPPGRKSSEPEDLHSESMCDQCGKLFRNIATLKRHTGLKHSNSRPFKCERCTTSFKYRLGLKIHGQRCSRKKQKKASANSGSGRSTQRLEKSLKRKYRKCLKRTEVITLPEGRGRVRKRRMYKCKACSKILSSKLLLTQHIYTHTKEANYLCSDCGRSFRRPWTFRNHVKSHSRKPNFFCRFCFRKFISRWDLRQHGKKNLLGIPVECEHCLILCSNKCQVKYHEEFHQPEEEVGEEGEAGKDSSLKESTLKDSVAGEVPRVPKSSLGSARKARKKDTKGKKNKTGAEDEGLGEGGLGIELKEEPKEDLVEKPVRRTRGRPKKSVKEEYLEAVQDATTSARALVIRKSSRASKDQSEGEGTARGVVRIRILKGSKEPRLPVGRTRSNSFGNSSGNTSGNASGKRMSRSPTKNPAGSSVQRASRSLVKASARSPSKNPPRSSSKNPPRSSSKNPPRSSSKNPPRSSSKNPPRSSSKNPPRSPSKNPPRSSSKNPPRSSSKNPPRSSSKKAPRSPVKVVPRSPVKVVPRSPSKMAPRSPVKAVPRSPSKKAPRSPVKAVPRSPSKKASRSSLENPPRSPVKAVPRSPVKTAPRSPKKSSAPNPSKTHSTEPPQKNPPKTIRISIIPPENPLLQNPRKRSRKNSSSESPEKKLKPTSSPERKPQKEIILRVSTRSKCKSLTRRSSKL